MASIHSQDTATVSTNGFCGQFLPSSLSSPLPGRYVFSLPKFILPYKWLYASGVVCWMELANCVGTVMVALSLNRSICIYQKQQMEAAEWSSRHRGQRLFHSSGKHTHPRLSWHQLLKPVRGKTNKRPPCARFGRSQNSLTLNSRCCKGSIHSRLGNKVIPGCFNIFDTLKLSNFNGILKLRTNINAYYFISV